MSNIAFNISHSKIPITIVMFKIEDKKLPTNYTVKNVLSTTLELTLKIITNEMNNLLTLVDEQQEVSSFYHETDNKWKNRLSTVLLLL